MTFSKAMPEAFWVTHFNGRRDNDRSKEPHVCTDRVSIAQLIAKQLV